MKKQLFFICFFCLCLSTSIQAQFPKLDLFPQSKTIGVNVLLDQLDPEGDCKAYLYYAHPRIGEKTVLPLSKVKNRKDLLSGVIFLQDTGKFDVAVMLRDASTSLLDGKLLQGSVIIAPPGEINPIRVRYVHPKGKGQNFTQAEPGNLYDALSDCKAGDLIHCLSGTYYLRNIFLSDKGNNENPIVIVGDGAVFSGEDTAKLVWSRYGSTDVWVTTSSAVNPNLFVINGTRAYPFRSLEELLSKRIGIGFNSLAQPVSFPAPDHGFFRNPSTNPLCNSNWQYPRLFFFHGRNQEHPDSAAIILSSANFGFSLQNCENIRFRGITFKAYGVSPAGRAVELNHCRNVSFDSCVFAYNDIGILLKGSSSNTRIFSCEFFDAMDHWSAWKVKATYDDYNPFSCIFPYYSRLLERGAILMDHGFTGRGLDIGHSSFHHYGQAGHLSPPSENPNFSLSYEIDFHHNKVASCFEDGFEIDGDARNVRVFMNVFENINAPLSLAPAINGPLYVIGNIFHHLRADTFTTHPDLGLQVAPGHPFKTNYGSHVKMGDIYFYNNTIDAGEDHWAMDFFSPADWGTFQLWNNVFVSDSGYLITYRAPTVLPVHLSHNLFYSKQNVPKFRWVTSSDNLTIHTDDIEEIMVPFKAMGFSGTDTFYASNPEFIPASFYVPSHESPLNNAGRFIEGITDDLFENKQFIGAIPPRSLLRIPSARRQQLSPRIYPNPSGNGWTIVLPETESAKRYMVISMDGSVITTGQGNNNILFIPKLPSGVYVFQVRSQNQFYAGKLVSIEY